MAKALIEEFVFADPALGMSVQLERLADGESRIRFIGEGIMAGNREYQFDEAGRFVGTGQFLGGTCRPTVMIDPDQI